jgi:hypothetical protein
MSDRPDLRRVFELAVPAVLLAVAAVGLVYAITIATTLRDLRAREPVSVSDHQDLETWRCLHAAGSAASRLAADGEPKLNSSGVSQHPTASAERSATCPPHPRQVRPQ